MSNPASDRQSEGDPASGGSSVSVVVAVTTATAPAARIAKALLERDADPDIEVVVVDGTASGIADVGLERCRILRRPGETLPKLKGAGVHAASGDIVAIVDPWDIPRPGWANAVRSAFENADPAGVGGAVAAPPGLKRADLGGYLFEYAAFAPPIREGPTDGDLPGNNVAYRRARLLEACAHLLESEGFNKPFLHQRLRERGERLVLTPAMVVDHQTTHTVAGLVRGRFHYGRCFGATRMRHASHGRRWLYRAFSPVLPVVLPVRYVARALRPATRGLLVTGGLQLLLIAGAWGVGEWLGYWFGPGSSCDRFV